MEIAPGSLVEYTLRLAVVAGEVANFCDHIEHNEAVRKESIPEAGAELRADAVALAAMAGRDPFELYADRLEAIESRNVLHHETSFDGGRMARLVETWRSLQLVQAAHDDAYHRDVVGLAKSDQLRHYALHVAKLAGATAAAAQGKGDQTDWLRRRVPDMLLFGIKLATVAGQKLPNEPLPRRVQDVSRPELRAASVSSSPP